MIRSSLTALSATCLIACSPASEELPEPAASSAAAARSIDGQYVVTHVNGAEPLINIAGYEPTITITGDRIYFQSQCIYDDWAFSRTGETIETGIWQAEQEMCARERTPGEEAIIKAIDGAETIRFVPHGLWLSGKGGTMQLRFIPSAEDLAARAVDLTGEWRVAGIDGKPLDAAYGIALSAGFDRIWWEPGCPGQGVTYSIRGSTFDAPEPENPGMVCDIAFPAELTQIWAALAAADSIERTPENGVLISGKGRSVLLFTQ